MSQELLANIFQVQRQTFLNDGFPNADIRIDRLKRLIDVHVQYKQDIVDALYEDFDGRPKPQSLFTDIVTTINAAKGAIKGVKGWMKSDKRKVPFPMGLMGAKAEVQYQPMGVIGNISPWNFPVALAFAPAVDAIAAGNRMIIKPSEFVPNTSEVISKMVSSSFGEEELAVVIGGVEVAQAFSSLPFDHLVFTGGPEIAKHVMSSAAKNLVPLTLELGGKCPVIVGQSANLKMVAERVMTMKVMNSGQLCLTPDYIFLPRGKEEEFIAAAKEVLVTFYKDLRNNDDYAAIINERHWVRLKGYLDELIEKDVRVEIFNPANENFDDPNVHRLPVTLAVEPADDLKIMQEEVFGPFLSVKTYDRFQDTIDFVNAKERPLALYYFGSNKMEIDRVSKETTSGGLCINDVAQHAACEDLPLAGVGNSGMGGYHGQHGFLQFSHKKAVYKQGLVTPWKFVQPPYSDFQKKLFNWMVR